MSALKQQGADTAAPIDMEECRAAGSVVVDFGKKYRGKPLDQCGKDWQLWVQDLEWVLEKYQQYLNANPGKCIIEFKGRWSGCTIDSITDIGYLGWFAYGHGVGVQKIFPACCEAARQWLESWKKSLYTVTTIPSVLDSQRKSEPAEPAPTDPEVLRPVYIDDMLVTEPSDIRHYMANRDIGELSRKHWDEFQAAFGDEDDYEYDEFLRPDSEDPEEASDVRSEVSAFYGEGDGAEHSSPEANSVIEISSDSKEEIVKTPQKRKRGVPAITTDDESEVVERPAPATPVPRSSQRRSNKPLGKLPETLQLPTPHPTPDKDTSSDSLESDTPRTPQRQVFRLPSGDCRAYTQGHRRKVASPGKRRMVVESSGDENDDEPLSQRLIRKQSSPPSSLKKKSVKAPVHLPSPTSSWFGDSDELSSDVDNFIEEDTPRKRASPASPQSSRTRRFLFD
ncbi:hypothetical protein CALCODRAFT_553746 [Calocera cornea HHB12733]|uniref:Uncharacterized protein n=1 Tax=Calocera cornea HHB12733 TaxID=1353952 RepID=A0A165I8Y4_9BASI|nr:hypothetical protein CALCODRAFT_553746 [Calocera cornea HHB12733]